MFQLYDNPELCDQLIDKGIARKDLFTWDRSSDLLWQTIEKVLP